MKKWKPLTDEELLELQRELERQEKEEVKK